MTGPAVPVTRDGQDTGTRRSAQVLAARRARVAAISVAGGWLVVIAAGIALVALSPGGVRPGRRRTG